MKMDQLGRLMLSCNGAIFLHLSAKMSSPSSPQGKIMMVNLTLFMIANNDKD